jgi:hypothetical protein
MTDRIPIHEGRKLLQAQATHKQIQSAVEEYLTVRGIPCSATDATEAYNRHGQRVRRVEEGWPDVTGCCCVRTVFGSFSGIFLAVEVKTAKDKLRPAQAKVLHELYQAGALVVVARSLDDLIVALETGKATSETLQEIAATLAKEGKRKRRRRAKCQ